MVFDSTRNYDPNDPYVLRYAASVREAIAQSSTLPDAQRRICSILEEAYTGRKNLDDPIRDIARQELRSLDERLCNERLRRGSS